ncbi:Dynein alpha chain, flagellar outer arm [Labeo rohita]|uniref:Dynein alpha chain, flagellar outer arm n=1 Tax=Labeo rohita TaxID=84645 RepID=A0ABQ8L8N7_LABRO|nr:Dynein alpha chain, flagellar outer arm [Labeo rohita]
MQIYLPVTTKNKSALYNKSEVIVFGPSKARTQNKLDLEYLKFRSCGIWVWKLTSS